MNKRRGRFGVTNAIFAGTVVVLVVVAAVGYGLYDAASSKQVSMTETMTTTSSAMTETMTTTASAMTETVTSTEMVNLTYAYTFTPHMGAMVNNAWLLVVPTGMHEYAVSVHAEGLESNGTYILEGALTTGSMQTVPISSESMTMNQTSASEFQSNSNGTALYWIVLSSDPATTFENVQLYFVPEGMMQNATLVATVTFTMISETSMTSSGGM